ncbi:MAG TPA: hypothetical protein GXX29_03425 [Firmicutes bacterium]|nr:hypothetical protein [Bacillota bacterium]
MSNMNPWANWTFGEFTKKVEEALEILEFPANASFAPLALHFYREGILLDLRYRNQVFASSWLSQFESMEAVQTWAIAETRKFIEKRREQKRLLEMKRSQG